MKLSEAPSSTTQSQPPTSSTFIENIMLQFVNGLQQFLGRNFATHKMVVGLVLTFWKDCSYKEQLISQLNMALTEEGGYEDLMPFILAMQKDCHVRVTVW